MEIKNIQTYSRGPTDDYVDFSIRPSSFKDKIIHVIQESDSNVFNIVLGILSTMGGLSFTIQTVVKILVSFIQRADMISEITNDLFVRQTGVQKKENEHPSIIKKIQRLQKA